MGTSKTDPPLVDIKVTNPVTYIKRWWAKVIGNEGMEIRFRIHPLTSIAIALIAASFTFGVGKLVLPFEIPFLHIEKDDEASQISPTPKFSTPTPDPWRDTGFTGTLQYSEPIMRFYLITTSSEAIGLEVPSNIDLTNYIGKRIFAAGKYNKTTRTLVVTSATNLEVLPKTPSPIPTTTSENMPTLSITPTEP